MSVDAKTGLSDKRETAKQLLLHYFKLTGDGRPMDGDNIVEIHEIVDLIVNAALEELTAAMEKVRNERGGGKWL